MGLARAIMACRELDPDFRRGERGVEGVAWLDARHKKANQPALRPRELRSTRLFTTTATCAAAMCGACPGLDPGVAGENAGGEL